MNFANQERGPDLTRLLPTAAWLVTFLICVLAYLPGLAGPFVLDDFVSIGALGKFGGVTDWTTFKAFVFGGDAGPTGRPLALLSFLIDASNWPTDPGPFKRTNLIIHLLNGAVLGCLISKILTVLDYDKHQAHRITLVATACWLLHPFLVSTTLYAVQRMAQLSTLFTFMGLIAYLHYRPLIATHASRAYVGMSGSVAVFTFLAMISKENGILLPVLIGVLEISVIGSRHHRYVFLNRYWAVTFIIAPSIIIALYLGEKFLQSGFFDVTPPRDFSVYERLLTQPRVLIDYLKHWFVPELYTTGIFQDHFLKSTGLLSPLTTLLSVLTHFGLILAALIKRREWPLFAFATLFFYASHLLESTVVNLELYFEHRNYLAAAFLFVPLIAFVQRKINRRLFAATMLAVVLALASFTRYSATVWSDFDSIVEASAEKAPTSARAQVQYATILFNQARYEEAVQVIEHAIQVVPNDRPLLLVNRLIMLCNLGTLTADDFERVSAVLSNKYYDIRSVKLYTSLITAVVESRCPDVSTASLRAMFANMLRVSRNEDPQTEGYSHIKYFIGLVDLHRGEPAKAVVAFDESLRSHPGVEEAMTMAENLAASQYLEEALYFSTLALSYLDAESQLRSVSEHDIREFQAAVKIGIEATDSGEQ